MNAEASAKPIIAAHDAQPPVPKPPQGPSRSASSESSPPKTMMRPSAQVAEQALQLRVLDSGPPPPFSVHVRLSGCSGLKRESSFVEISKGGRGCEGARVA